MNKFKPFELETGTVYRIPQYILNCHTCGKMFSPVDVALIPTDLYTYYDQVYSRFILLTILGANVNICDHLYSQFCEKWGISTMHDPVNIPQLLGKIYKSNPVDVSSDTINGYIEKAFDIFLNRRKEIDVSLHNKS